MFQYQMRRFYRTLFSYLSVSVLSLFCVLLLILDADMVEARLIWIPRTTEIREGSVKDQGSMGVSNYYEVRTFISFSTFCTTFILPLSIYLAFTIFIGFSLQANVHSKTPLEYIRNNNQLVETEHSDALPVMNLLCTTSNVRHHESIR